MQKMTLIAILLLSTAMLSAAVVKIMTYNSLNFNDDDTDRVDDFETVFDQISPTILVMQEMHSDEGCELMLEALNDDYDDYMMAPFVDGYDSDNILFYKKACVDLLGMDYIETDLREIGEYEVEVFGVPLNIYSCHLKASQGGDNEQQRLYEVTILRNRLNNLPGIEFVIMGDMNIYTSDEPAYEKFIANENDNDGRARDTIDEIGNWHDNSQFADVHTQSTRTDQVGGGATGGLDDRFDYIFVNYYMNDDDGIEYIEDSVVPFGNDGNHLNQSINEGTNSAVPSYVADALHDASDHLPVFGQFQTYNMPTVILDYLRVDIDANIEWKTYDEEDLMGYYVYCSATDDFEDAVRLNDMMIEANNSSGGTEYSLHDTSTPTGYWYFWLEMVALNGVTEVTYPIYHGIVGNDDPTVPQYAGLEIEPNYPNPFNPTTTIRFTIPAASQTRVEIYNIRGEKVTTLHDGNLEEGPHTLTWHGTNDQDDVVASGIYFCRVSTDNESKMIRMLMMK